MMTHTRIPTIQPITIATLEEDLSLPDGFTVALVDIDDEKLVVGSTVTEDIVVNGIVDNIDTGVGTVVDTGVDTVMDTIVSTGADTVVVDTVIDTSAYKIHAHNKIASYCMIQNLEGRKYWQI